MSTVESKDLKTLKVLEYWMGGEESISKGCDEPIYTLQMITGPTHILSCSLTKINRKHPKIEKYPTKKSVEKIKQI